MTVSLVRVVTSVSLVISVSPVRVVTSVIEPGESGDKCESGEGGDKCESGESGDEWEGEYLHSNDGVSGVVVNGRNGGVMNPLLQLLDALLSRRRYKHDPGEGAEFGCHGYKPHPHSR